MKRGIPQLRIGRWAPAALLLVVLGSSSGRAAAQPNQPNKATPAPVEPTPVTKAEEEARAERAAEALPPLGQTQRVRIQWNEAWPRFSTGEYIATATLILASFGALAIPTEPTRWTQTNAFDLEISRAMVPDDEQARFIYRDATDVLIGVMYNQLAVDAAIVAWWGHGNRDTAWQLAMMDLEALAFTATVTNVVKGLASRERPYGHRCTGPEASQPDDCTGLRRYRSFFSGHASSAFTVAGLMCMHHAHLPLYGGGAAEDLTCVGSLGAASATAVLRVMAEQHYPTDVLAGSALGALSGFGLPWLLHYRFGSDTATKGARADSDDFRVQLAPYPSGAALIGTF